MDGRTDGEIAGRMDGQGFDSLEADCVHGFEPLRVQGKPLNPVSSILGRVMVQNLCWVVFVYFSLCVLSLCPRGLQKCAESVLNATPLRALVL